MLQAIISGLATGCLYSLIAIGLVLIYKATDIVNFAQGEMAMFVTFITFTLAVSMGFNMGISIMAGLLCAFLLGVLIDRVAINNAHNVPELSVVIITIAIMLILNGIAGWIWGYEPLSFPQIFVGEPIRIGDAFIGFQSLMNIGIAVCVMFVFFLLFKFTLLGISMRAIAENAAAAKIVGIPVKIVIMLTWGISGILAGLAGILIAPASLLETHMMAVIIVKAYTAAVVGGFNSLPGAIIGGILLGISENLIGVYISTELKSTFAFLLIIIVLMLKPNGLLGTTVQKKV